MTVLKKISSTEYRKPTAVHYVFLASLAALILEGVILRLTCASSSVSEELVQTGLAVFCAAAIAALAHYFRVLDRFPRKYPALASFLSAALMVIIAFLDNRKLFIDFHTEAHIFLAVLSVAFAIYALKETGVLGTVLSIAATFFCVFITCGAHDDKAGIVILAVSILMIAFSVLSKWYSEDALWLQVLLLLFTVVFSAMLMMTLFPDTEYYIWKSLFSEPVFPIPDVEWMGADNPILSYNIIAGAKLIGSSGDVFPLQEAVKWHLFTYIAYRGGWVALVASLLPVAGMTVSGFVLAVKQRGLRRFISFGVMIWATVLLLGYILFNFGINYWQAKNVPLFSGDFLANELLLVGLGVVVSTKREQCYSAQPGRLHEERRQFWTEFPDWISSEEAHDPKVSLWIEDVEDVESDLKKLFQPGRMVKSINLDELEKALPTAKNCAVFRYSGLIKHTNMALYSFALTRDHNFIKFVAPPSMPMDTLLEFAGLYIHGCEKDADYCIEIDETIDRDSIEIYGVGI